MSLSQSKNNSKTVFVGLSGGVDSSVAALRLLQQGYKVVGVFIKVWHPDWLECNWEEERLDAMRVAAHLGIPFLTCDAEEDYRRDVGEYFVREYQAGRVPNPDVMCNRYVKFGAFMRFAIKNGADYIATGHYARVREDGGVFRLYKGVDRNKDQSYFLWTLTQNELSRLLLPIGDTNKEDIRKEAELAGLPTAVKKDSQGICFLGHIDIPDFLSHYSELSSGPVLDVHGNTIGTHKGALVYTLGQRHGFTIDNKGTASTPHFVVAKDMGSNTVIVDTTPPVVVPGSHIYLESVSWTAEPPKFDSTVSAMVRYRQEPFEAKLSLEGDKIVVYPEVEVEKPPAGQSCVLYQGDECIGGGVIG